MSHFNFNPFRFCFLYLLMHVGKLVFLFLFFVSGTAELHLSGLIGRASHQDKQKIRMIEFSLKTVYIASLRFGCYCLQHVPASKPLPLPFTCV
jgi:hypothetical protein